jgi:hypothetical protein
MMLLDALMKRNLLRVVSVSCHDSDPRTYRPMKSNLRMNEFQVEFAERLDLSSTPLKEPKRTQKDIAQMGILM